MPISDKLLNGLIDWDKYIANLQCIRCERFGLYYQGQFPMITTNIVPSDHFSMSIWRCMHCDTVHHNGFRTQYHHRCPFHEWAAKNNCPCICSGKGWIRI